MTPFAALIALGAAQAAPPTVLTSWSFDTAGEGFSASGETLQWTWGTVESGPGSGNSSESAWATVLDGAYLHATTDYLDFPSTDLRSASRPVLGLTHWFDIDPAGDLGWLERGDSGSWEVVEPVYGYPESGGFADASGTWVTHWFELDGLDNTANLRFVLTADDQVSRAGWYIDGVTIYDGDPIPPDIRDLSGPEDNQDLDGPHMVYANITDDTLVESAWVHWFTDRGDTGSVELSPDADTLYTGAIPAFEPDTTISWWLEASDGNSTTQSETETFRVYLAAPGAPTGPEGRVVGLEAELTWDAPESPHEVLRYVLYRDGVAVAEAEASPGQAPLNGPVDSFQIAASYSTPIGEQEGDWSETLTLDVAVPEVDPLSPDHGWQGDLLRVSLSGENLFLSADSSTLDLGENITLVNVELENVNSAAFTFELGTDATTGWRDAELISGDLSLTLPAAFEVLDGGDRPALTSISPDTIRQGEQGVLVIEANQDLASSEPVIDLGDGIVLADITVSGALITVAVTVAPDAPLGARQITVDDGVRILEGPSLLVRNQRTATSSVCGCGSGPGAAGGGILALLLLLGFAERREP